MVTYLEKHVQHVATKTARDPFEVVNCDRVKPQNCQNLISTSNSHHFGVRRILRIFEKTHKRT